MRRFLSLALFLVLSLSLLAACGNKDDKEKAEETVAETEETEETTEEQEEAEETDPVEIEEEEETFADEIKVMDLETVLDDQKEIDGVEEEENILIEHESLFYIKHDFITDVLDFELTYDEENTYAEVFEKKGDFVYEPTHEEEGGAIMDLGQIYDEASDEYKEPDSEYIDNYRFIEYDGNLYVSARFVEVYLGTPVQYERRDKTLVLGEKSEETSIFDVGLAKGSTSSAEETQTASDVTIKGKNYKSGILVKDVNSADKLVGIHTDFKYTHFEGLLYNKSDEKPIEVAIQYHEGKTIDTVTVQPGESKKVSYDVKGEAVLVFIPTAKAGASEEFVIIGNVK